MTDVSAALATEQPSIQRPRPGRNWRSGAGAWLPDAHRSIENLLMHKLRSLLTMLGMIFGVAAVLSMLSIGAGAQQQVMAFIEELGVRNLIVEAREATDWNQLQKARQQSPGLTFHDVRAIQATVEGLETLTPRKRFTPTKIVPKPQTELPTIYGVEPAYQRIAASVSRRAASSPRRKRDTRLRCACSARRRARRSSA
jgi:hypothetical protein